MPKSIFVSMAVEDLSVSRSFYTALGFEINETFSDDKAICVAVSDTIFAMLLRKDFFATFTDKELVDAKVGNEVQLSITHDSRAEVDEIAGKALAAGGTEADTQDHGFMYSRSFEDPDGHRWDALWMDPQAATDGPTEMTVEDIQAGITRP
ncbi:VOC family protein [Frigoribacterium sp. 2-23]|uniref:VOC family protein n=1 Tax=Frigoribacterium sp. 2-23 TaxID=3415006 RepID=UPI003C703C31